MDLLKKMRALPRDHPLRKGLDSSGFYQSISQALFICHPERDYEFTTESDELKSLMMEFQNITRQLAKIEQDSKDLRTKQIQTLEALTELQRKSQQERQEHQKRQERQAIKIVTKDDAIVVPHILSAVDIAYESDVNVLCWHSDYLESLLRNLFVLVFDEPSSLARCIDLLERIINCKELSIILYNNADIVTHDPVAALDYVKTVSADNLPLYLKIKNEYGVETEENRAALAKKFTEYDERIKFLKNNIFE